MDELGPRLRELGRAVARVSDRGADRATLDGARRRWLAPAPPLQGVRRRTIAIAFAAAACIALGTGAVLLGRSGDDSFEVGSPPARGAVGDWIAAEPDAALGVRFSEGSHLTLAPNARVRVTEATAGGASILIEHGQVRAAVVHAGAQTRWAIVAGPSAVRVVGTALDAAWDPSTERFDLTMHEGSTIVTGPLLDAGRTLVAGERLGVSVRQGRLEITAASVAPSADTSAAEQQPVAPAAEPPVATDAPTAMPSGAPPGPSATVAPWRELGRGGALRGGARRGRPHRVLEGARAGIRGRAHAARRRGSLRGAAIRRARGAARGAPPLRRTRAFRLPARQDRGRSAGLADGSPATRIAARVATSARAAGPARAARAPAPRRSSTAVRYAWIPARAASIAALAATPAPAAPRASPERASVRGA